MSKPNVTVTIPKDVLAQLPVASFVGDIKVIDKPEDVDAAIDELESAPIVGFDTETRPSFKKGFNFQMSLLQLSTEKRGFLFRLNKIGVPQRIIDYLENPDKLKIGLSLHDDFNNLNKICSVFPQGFIDLQQYVQNFLISDISLTKIYGILFGKRISKAQRLSNWEASTLTGPQQHYAALDAQACIDIYRFLRSGQFKPFESPYCVPIEEPDTSTES